MTPNLYRQIDASLWRDEFPLAKNTIYLNHAGVSPWPRRAAEAVTAFAEDNVRHGASNYSHWLETERRLREQLRQLINAPGSDDIALLKNTSEGLSFVANGIAWSAGDNIVISAEEFPSNRIPWEALQPRGVAVRQIEMLNGHPCPEQPLLDACDGRTRLLAISSVQYASGFRVDLDLIGAHCRKHGILLCVDAIQTLGALNFDVSACHADFVVADAHKWMLGPEGIALFYVNPAIRDEITLSEFGWHMTQDPGAFDRKDWRPADSARRFECGSPNLLGVHALSASLSLLHEIGMAAISRIVLNNTRYLTDLIKL
ncbi:MAG: aminotransferase class V-fold PLP-dependent enzyme, partial [Gammaproteobacteria bacterium]